jgi:hypothetical protein
MAVNRAGEIRSFRAIQFAVDVTTRHGCQMPLQVYCPLTRRDQDVRPSDNRRNLFLFPRQNAGWACYRMDIQFIGCDVPVEQRSVTEFSGLLVREFASIDRSDIGMPNLLPYGECVFINAPQSLVLRALVVCVHDEHHSGRLRFLTGAPGCRDARKSLDPAEEAYCRGIRPPSPRRLSVRDMADPDPAPVTSELTLPWITRGQVKNQTRRPWRGTLLEWKRRILFRPQQCCWATSSAKVGAHWDLWALSAGGVMPTVGITFEQTRQRPLCDKRQSLVDL